MVEGTSPRRTVFVSVAVAVAAGVIFALGVSALELEDPWAHALGHLSGAIPAALLLAAILFTWPPPGTERISKVARSVLIGGLAVLCVGWVTEALGAFGDRTSVLATGHDAGVVVGALGLLVTLLGGALSMGAAALNRLGLTDSRWVKVMVWSGAALVALFLLGGLIFGY